MQNYACSTEETCINSEAIASELIKVLNKCFFMNNDCKDIVATITRFQMVKVIDQHEYVLHIVVTKRIQNSFSK